MGIQTVSQALSNENGGSSPFGFKNRIINGAMVIDQRNAGASVSASGAYAVDRFQFYVTQASKLTAQQNAGSVTPPPGFTNYMGFTSSSAYSLLSTDLFETYQIIEGFNFADMDWGKSTAKKVTLSFWVRSSLTGTFGGVFLNSAQNYNYPYSYTINNANTWEYKTITVPGATSGTWLGTNNACVLVGFQLGAGSTWLGTPGAWTTTNYHGVTGQQSLVSTSGATWYITGVQVEKGEQATAFDYRDYGNELRLCQRYYYRLNPSSTGTGLISTGWAVSTTSTAFSIPYPVQMRVQPTALEQSGTAAHYQIVYQASAAACSGVPTFGSETTVDRTRLEATVASGLTAGNGVGIRYASTSAYLAWSAEL
jgi:hypothetical protein